LGCVWLGLFPGVFGWAITFEKVIVGWASRKSNCEMWIMTFWKSSFGLTDVAFEMVDLAYK
jgi:hypothetical protein